MVPLAGQWAISSIQQSELASLTIQRDSWGSVLTGDDKNIQPKRIIVCNNFTKILCVIVGKQYVGWILLVKVMKDLF